MPIVAGATDPKLPEPVDVALLCNTLMHVEDPQALLATLRAQTADRGRAFVVDWKPDLPGGGPGPSELMRQPAAAVVDVAERVGWQAVAVDHDSLPFQYVVELRKVGQPAPD